MVDLFVLLGLRYLCILRGNALWKTQDGTGVKPEKISGRCCRRVVGAALLTLIYGFLFRGSMHVDVPYIFMMAGICAAGALISMVGDLAASAIKRNLISKIMEN